MSSPRFQLVATLCALTLAAALLFSNGRARAAHAGPLLRSWTSYSGPGVVDSAPGAVVVAPDVLSSAAPPLARSESIAPSLRSVAPASDVEPSGASASAENAGEKEAPAPSLWVPPTPPRFVDGPVSAPPPSARLVRAMSSALSPAKTASAASAAPLDSCAPTYRGVLDPSLVVQALQWKRVDGAVRFAHSVPGVCKKWIRAFQNIEAGLGHRLRQWSTSLWLSTAMPPTTRVAFAHTSVDEGQGGMHHNYKGFDEFLGLTLGEGSLGADALVSSGTAKEFPCELERVNGPAAYSRNIDMVQKYESRMGNPSDCNVVYRLPINVWAEDHSTATRGISAWKFASAAAARAAAGARIPLAPPEEWDPAAVHVGVHFRVNDGYLITEETLAAVLRDYALSALAAAGVGARVKIHIFTEEEGVDKTPAIHALASPPKSGAPLPGGVDVYEVLVDPRSALWMMSQTDIFVGCVSSFSWIVAQFSTRPAALLQDWQEGGSYKWCLTGAGCCQRDGTCDYEAKLLMVETAERLAKMHSCGQLNRASWEDEADMPLPVPEEEK